MESTHTGHEAGHKFLARLGKKRLRLVAAPPQNGC